MECLLLELYTVVLSVLLYHIRLLQQKLEVFHSKHSATIGLLCYSRRHVSEQQNSFITFSN